MCKTGLALRFYGSSKPLRVEEASSTSLGPREVLIDVKAAGICASDIHYINRTESPVKMPLTLGHEGAGVVAGVGKDVDSSKVGERVSIHYVISCEGCRYCLSGRENLCPHVKWAGFELDGTFSEYIKLPVENVLPLPQIVSFEEGALIGCAVVTPFHAMKVGGVKPGDVVAIIGIGGVGIHAVQMARIFGAKKVIALDLADHKLKLAEVLGADVIVNPKNEDPIKAVMEATSGEGVDLAYEFVGTKNTVLQALKMVGPGGRTVLVGLYRGALELNVSKLLYGEEQIRTSMDHTRWDLKQTIDLVANGRIDLSKSVTYKLPLKEGLEGIKILKDKLENTIRVVLNP